jgi:hypothetical protein
VKGPSDPRAALFDAAKQKEIGINRTRTEEEVLKDEMQEKPNIMGYRFVLAIKDSGTSNEMYKARYVVQ